jgi:hypothetical protein
MAAARSSGSRKIALMMARLPGSTMAGPRPCTTRAPISMPTFGASPASSEPRPNSTTPSRNMGLRPRRSESTPPATIRLTKAST